jgi:hypothetical protein
MKERIEGIIGFVAIFAIPAEFWCWVVLHARSG